MPLQYRDRRFWELIVEKMKIAQSQYNFDRIAKAIGYIQEHRGEQPDLRTVAEAVAMSPYHFQRMFQEWAGVSPKHFLQFLNVNYAKRIMMETRLSLLDVAGRRDDPRWIQKRWRAIAHPLSFCPFAIWRHPCGFYRQRDLLHGVRRWSGEYPRRPEVEVS